MVVASSIVVSLNQAGEEINDRLEDPEHKVQSSRKAGTLLYDLAPPKIGLLKEVVVHIVLLGILSLVTWCSRCL